MTQHMMVSALLGGFVYLGFRSAAAAAACFLAGVFLDLDHLLDYYLNHGVSLRIGHFLRTFRTDVLKYIVVFLHSWELILLSLLLAWGMGWRPVAVGIFVGAAVHLLLDHIFNGHSAFAYFLTYRLANGFAARRFYGESEYKSRLAASKTPPKKKE